MSGDLHVREWLATGIKALVPSTWRVIAEQRMPPVIDEITLVIKHFSMTPLREARRATIDNEVTITVVDPHQDLAAAEDALDDAVLELCMALDQINDLTWTDAKKVNVSDTYIGWDITIRVITRKVDQ